MSARSTAAALAERDAVIAWLLHQKTTISAPELAVFLGVLALRIAIGEHLETPYDRRSLTNNPMWLKRPEMNK